MLKSWTLSLIYSILDHIPPVVWLFINVLNDIILFWTYKFFSYIRPRSRFQYHEAVKSLELASTYRDWCEKATVVDEITGSNLWRRNFFSRRYDFNSVLEQHSLLSKYLEKKDIESIKEKFCTIGPCMLRNFAGIVDKGLFTKALMGTKLLIEHYQENVIQGLDLLDKSSTPTSYFQRCKLSLGTTALILKGGSMFGLFHLGVIRGLLSQKLMPNIISGSSMGACVASLFGCISNEELIDLLQDDKILNIIKYDIDLLRSSGYGNVEQHVNIGTLIQNLLHNGYSQDVYLFIQFVNKYIVKELTFEEAYQKTGKVFNIVIHPTDPSCPNLLNYVTTPNMLISSAIYCSMGSGVILEDAKLLCKNLDNEVIPFLVGEKNTKTRFLAPENANFNEAYSPYTRLTELFNVNNFIVSLARPYLAPFVVNDLKHEIKTSKYYYYKHFPDTPNANMLSQLDYTEMEPLAFKFKYHLERKIKNIITMEFRHRMEVLDNLGLLCSWIKRLIIDDKTPRSAIEITIVPKMKNLTVTRVVEGQLDNINYWLQGGEQNTWLVLPLIKTRCTIEYKLDNIIKTRRNKVNASYIIT